MHIQQESVLALKDPYSLMMEDQQEGKKGRALSSVYRDAAEALRYQAIYLRSGWKFMAGYIPSYIPSILEPSPMLYQKLILSVCLSHKV